MYLRGLATTTGEAAAVGAGGGGVESLSGTEGGRRTLIFGGVVDSIRDAAVVAKVLPLCAVEVEGEACSRIFARGASKKLQALAACSTGRFDGVGAAIFHILEPYKTAACVYLLNDYRRWPGRTGWPEASSSPIAKPPRSS